MIHPARLAAAFSPPVPQTVAEKLLAEPRFADRITAMLGTPADIDPKALALRAGAVLHSRRFVREIRGPAIAEMTARFGAAVLADARAHADLGWDREGDPDTIEADGMACIGAWIAQLDPATRARVVLHWPDDAALPQTDDPAILTLGPQIVNRLAGTP